MFFAPIPIYSFFAVLITSFLQSNSEQRHFCCLDSRPIPTTIRIRVLAFDSETARGRKFKSTFLESSISSRREFSAAIVRFVKSYLFNSLSLSLSPFHFLSALCESDIKYFAFLLLYIVSLSTCYHIQFFFH